MFNKVLRRDGKEFTNCYVCSAKAREARLAAAANPTTAQVKKAQAVILAANVAAKDPTSDPIIPTSRKGCYQSIHGVTTLLYDCYNHH